MLVVSKYIARSTEAEMKLGTELSLLFADDLDFEDYSRQVIFVLCAIDELF